MLSVLFFCLVVNWDTKNEKMKQETDDGGRDGGGGGLAPQAPPFPLRWLCFL